MSYRDKRLRQFFGGYFHQDWDTEGAETWQDVAAQYVERAQRRDVRLTCEDLRGWLEETKAAKPPLPASFGCDYDPRPDGLDERAWVAALADYLEELTRA